jgi:acetyl-CoA carboxylase biotin carboxyl carrier protein
MEANELKDLKELIEFLRANDIAEFDLEKDELKVRLKFASGVVQPAAASAPAVDMATLARLMSSAGASAGLAVNLAPAGESAASPAAAASERKHHVVKSPIVGTFYDAPAPGSPPFVKIGDVVEIGQVLCIVEAMKLMNEIESDMAGEIVERVASTGQPVEYGQSLFRIRER